MNEITLVAIVLVVLTGVPFLIISESDEEQIKGQGEPNMMSLNSSGANVDGNDTQVLSNDSTSGEQMKIQICDESHPC
jgi:hypothetical protein